MRETTDQIRAVSAKLESAHKVVRAREVNDPSFWRDLHVNRVYCCARNSYAKFLVLTGDALLAAEKIRSVLPLAQEFRDEFHLLQAPNGDVWDKDYQHQRLIGARRATAYQELLHALNCLFFDPIVSRSGLPANQLLANVVLSLGIPETLTRDQVAALLDSIYPDKIDGKDVHGWSFLRVYLWQFGCYDEYRIFNDAETFPTLKRVKK